MRLFIAVEIPADARERLAEVGAFSRERSWRWVAPENVHLTLKFLGEVEPELQAEIRAALVGAAASTAPFEAALAGLGTLPSGRRPPRVLFADLSAGHAGLGELRRAVETTLEPLGFPKEGRPFRPHATLARVRRGGRPRDVAELRGRFAGVEFGRWECAAVILYQSVLGRGGPRYSVLDEFPLGGSDSR